MSPPSAAVSAEDIAASPAWLPLDAALPGAMRLVRLDEAAYRAASFLDQRMLGFDGAQAVVPLATVAAAAATLAPGGQYLFHIGHVGSTLVSRLIGEVDGFFSLREPHCLRDIALQGQRAEVRGLQLRDALALLGRPWRTGQRVVVKATSFVGEVAESILQIDGGAAAISMFTPALAYLRCILGGPNSRLESRALAPLRLARLRTRFGVNAPPEPRSEGEWIAMSWLCEMCALQQAAARFPSRILWVDFDRFLAAPAAGLEAMVRRFGASPDPKEIEGIVAGPLPRRYSKAPEHAYDAALRRCVLAAADREHAREIRRGMQWLARAGGLHPLSDEVLAEHNAAARSPP